MLAHLVLFDPELAAGLVHELLRNGHVRQVLLPGALLPRVICRSLFKASIRRGFSRQGSNNSTVQIGALIHIQQIIQKLILIVCVKKAKKYVMKTMLCCQIAAKFKNAQLCRFCVAARIFRHRLRSFE
jgi:hypothetical protein